MTIISASYRTDIPAFYSDWFENRLKAGFCLVKNPYGGKASHISLAREDVTAFVFWTRNIKPFENTLAQRIAGNYPFMVQFTITGYPKLIERSVIDDETAVQQIKNLALEYGPNVCVWRYDPILISNITPVEFHILNFKKLAKALSGSVSEVIVSFAHFYKKTERNLQALSQKSDFQWQDPAANQTQELLQSMLEIATAEGIKLSICSQPEDLIDGVYPAKCIDFPGLQTLGAGAVKIKQKGNRPGCDCFQSRDIGAYDTCPHGCAYCYAVTNPQKTKADFRDRNPLSEFL